MSAIRKQAVDEFKDIEVLKQAAIDLGLTVVPNARAKSYYGFSAEKHTLVFRKQGMQFDVSVDEADGKITLGTDWHARHVEKVVGKNYGLLKQQYAAAFITQQARRRGKRVSRTLGHDGRIVLKIAGY